MSHSAADDAAGLPAAYILLMLDVVKRWHISDAELLGPFALDRQQLSVPTLRLPLDTVNAIYASALRLTEEPGLPFYMGMQMKLSSHGFIGFAAMTADTVAQALELGLVTPETMFDVTPPLRIGNARINEFEGKNYGPQASVSDIITKSSNVGTGRIALLIGGLRQQAFLKSLGLFSPSPVELAEARAGRPLIPKKWPDIVTVTAAYGQGVSSSSLNLAAAYAAIAQQSWAVSCKKFTLMHNDSEFCVSITA